MDSIQAVYADLENEELTGRVVLNLSKVVEMVIENQNTSWGFLEK